MYKERYSVKFKIKTLNKIHGKMLHNNGELIVRPYDAVIMEHDDRVRLIAVFEHKSVYKVTVVKLKDVGK